MSNKLNLNIQKFGGDGSTVDFTNMSQGISQAGIMEIYSSIHSFIQDEAATALADTDALVAALEQGWEGADRLVFIENLNKLATQIQEKLNEYDLAIQKEFTNIAENWNDFQHANVSAK